MGARSISLSSSSSSTSFLCFFSGLASKTSLQQAGKIDFMEDAETDTLSHFEMPKSKCLGPLQRLTLNSSPLLLFKRELEAAQRCRVRWRMVAALFSFKHGAKHAQGPRLEKTRRNNRSELHLLLPPSLRIPPARGWPKSYPSISLSLFPLIWRAGGSIFISPTITKKIRFSLHPALSLSLSFLQLFFPSPSTPSLSAVRYPRSRNAFIQACSGMVKTH